MLDPSILVGTSSEPIGSEVAAAQAMLQRSSQQVQAAESYTRVLAAVVEIQTKLDGCTELKYAAEMAATLVAESMSAERVLVGWRKSGQQLCDLIADTTTDSAQRDILAIFRAAAEEISGREDVTVYPAQDHANRHALLTVGKFAESIGAVSVVASRLVDSRGECRGVIIALNSELATPTQPQAVPIEVAPIQMAQFGPALGNKLSAIETMQPRVWERVLRSLIDPASLQKRKVMLACLAAAIVVMCLPVPYHIAARCELQPVQRRYVAAPFDGPLKSVVVRPGDVVASGELLATIDPREINYELAGLRAELRQAIQEKKGLMAEHDFGKGRIATLEAQRLQMQKELLQYQRDNLEIRSPLSGVVVSGDLKQSEGAPFSKGDPMFEIAPLGEMVVEIAIPESDLQHAEVGMPVQFLLDALPSQKLTGQLEKIYPQAELRDNQNVFVGEVSLQDTDGVLRPGMRGRAWITSDRHPLGWNLFHHAYYSLRQWIGW